MSVETPKQVTDFKKVVEQIKYVTKNKSSIPYDGLKLDEFNISAFHDHEDREIRMKLPTGDAVKFYWPESGGPLDVMYCPSHEPTDRKYMQIWYKVISETGEGHAIGDVVFYKKIFGNNFDGFDVSSDHDHFKWGEKGKVEYVDMNFLDRALASFLQVTELLKTHLRSKGAAEVATALEK